MHDPAAAPLAPPLARARDAVSRWAAAAWRVVPPSRRAVARRAARCLTVSVGTTVWTFAVLAGLVVGLGMRASTGNVVAVCTAIPLSYVGNRRWVWGRTGRSSVATEVVPFWVLNLAGLVLSTLAVARAASLTVRWPADMRAVALPAANLAAFGVLWVAQFAVLDRVLFRARPAECPVRCPVEVRSDPGRG